MVYDCKIYAEQPLCGDVLMLVCYAESVEGPSGETLGDRPTPVLSGCGGMQPAAHRTPRGRVGLLP